MANDRLVAISNGGRLEAVGAPVAAGQAGAHLLGEVGAEDAEHPASSQSQRPQLQQALSGLVDRDCSDKLTAQADAEERLPDARRLRDLKDTTVSSEWLWAVDPRSPAALAPDAFVSAALRWNPFFAGLAAGSSTQGAPTLYAALLGRAREDTTMFGTLFSTSSTWRMPLLRKRFLVLEAAPGLRPADILTSAASPGLTSALDVGIASPDAAHAGADCAEAMRVRKRAVYSRFLPALEAEGIEYRPLVWSCWGREYPDTTATLTQLARQAARRRGMPDHIRLLQRARAQIGAALARRAAAMLRACMPGYEQAAELRA
ncbi:unnamed protein product [Polarella glacialis]|uniref:Uncharacterized protein n=1 Tax=Polarella glacialis TaxID=89957 RepID=A0A813H8W7_POLGL|nr:unnamed protein product [Polarella glacialis]